MFKKEFKSKLRKDINDVLKDKKQIFEGVNNKEFKKVLLFLEGFCCALDLFTSQPINDKEKLEITLEQGKIFALKLYD